VSGNDKNVFGTPSTANIGCFGSLASGLLKNVISILMKSMRIDLCAFQEAEDTTQTKAPWGLLATDV
jgi:hypothetical protein